MSLFIFQFGLLQPIASIVNSQWPIALFTVCLMVITIYNNGLKVKKYVMLTFVLLSIYFFINALIYQDSMLIILSIYIGFMSKGFTAFFIGSLDTDGENLYNAFLKISVLNFIVIAFFPFTSFLDSMNYMRFGYAMIPSVIMFFYSMLSNKFYKPLWAILFLMSFVLMTIYGSRGTLVVFFILLLLLFVFSNKVSKIKKAILLISSILLVYLIAKFNIIQKLIDYLYIEIGIKSYTLSKFRMTLDSGLLEASSGRDQIYSYLLSFIAQNPIAGYGIGYSQRALDFTAHNIFLQILIETGVLGLLIWILVWLYCTNKYIKTNHISSGGFFKIVTLVICIALGRLLISSDMWLRPEYWFALSMLFNFKIRE